MKNLKLGAVLVNGGYWQTSDHHYTQGTAYQGSLIVHIYYIVVGSWPCNRNIQYFTYTYVCVTPCGKVISVYLPKFLKGILT